MNYEKMNNIIYDRWEKDDCDGIYEEIFSYMIMSNTFRRIMEMDDERITKKMIIDTIKMMCENKNIIDEARELSSCFEEKL